MNRDTMSFPRRRESIFCEPMMKNKQGIKIQAAIREILFYDWDPINVSDNENLKDEYDSYIAGVYRILIGSRNSNELVEYLRNMEINEIGNDPSYKEHEQKLKGIAEKFLALDLNI
jgi:hypothetical protein